MNEPEIIDASIRGLVLRGAGGLVDIEFDGNRVYSVQLPVMDVACQYQEVLWPGALSCQLRGRSVVTVVSLGSRSRPVDVAWSKEAEPLRLIDSHGRRLSINKWGRLQTTFSGSDTGLADRILDATETILHALRDFGVEPFAVYGTLLGAIREGDLIAHDDDTDVAYLSGHTSPVEVVRESLRLRDHLAGLGYECRRHSYGHLQVVFRVSGVLDFYVDIFTSWFDRGHWHLAFAVREPMSVDAILPLGQATIRDRVVPTPAQPKSVLESIYGAGWSTPDPAFKFVTPEHTRERFHAYLGVMNQHRDYWESFYAERADAIPQGATPFGRWLIKNLPRDCHILELGCGTGRDTRALLKAGHRVSACDYSAEALKILGTEKTDGLTMHQVNLYDLDDILGLISSVSASWQSVPPPRRFVYGRFLLHALEPSGQQRVLDVVQALGTTGYFEFRTADDSAEPPIFGEHFRSFVDLDALEDWSGKRGLAVSILASGRGLAPFAGEDPQIARVILRDPGV